MIWQILRDLDQKTRNNLYYDKYICGCVFRSFNDFEASIFFRFLFNGKSLQKKQVSQMLQDEGKNRLQKTLINFANFNICDNPNGGKINLVFAEGVQKYINDPNIDLQEGQINQYNSLKQSFSLLGLLFKNDNNFNQILESCNLQHIGYQDQNILSKNNFKFISSNVSTKIGILIKGFLKYRNSEETVRAIIQLNFLNPNKYYKIKPQRKQIIDQLTQLRLVKKSLDNKYFRISNALHHFAFQSKKQYDVNQGFQCQINIETNFKVYAKVDSYNASDFKNFKGIMRKLITLQYEDFNIQQLIIGRIEQEKTKRLLKQIKSQDFFNFFKQYIDSNTTLQKDLGKWKKLKFLGLQGPDQESVIPNNVKQQVKLWESLGRQQL